MSLSAKIISWLESESCQNFAAVTFVILSSTLYFGETNFTHCPLAQLQNSGATGTGTAWETLSNGALAAMLGLGFYIGLNLIVFTVGVSLYYVKWIQGQNPKTVARPAPGEGVQNIRLNRCFRRG